MLLPRCRHTWSWFCSPTGGKQLTTIHGQDTTKKILECRGETEAHPSCITETKTDCIRRVRGATTRWLHHPSLGWPAPLTLWFFPGGRRAQDECPPKLWVISWELQFWSHPTEVTWGTFGAWPVGIWLSWRRKEGFATRQHSGLDRLTPYIQHSRRRPNQQLCSSKEPRWWCSHSCELGGIAGLPDSGVHIRTLLALDPGLSLSRLAVGNGGLSPSPMNY